MVGVGNYSNNSALSTSSLDTLISFIDPLYIKILIGMLTILIGIVIGKIVEKLLFKLLYLININKLFHNIFKIKFRADYIISRMVFYALTLSALVISMNQLSLTRTIIIIFVSVLAPTLVLLFMFGLNDVVLNFFAGLILRLKINISLNDYIVIKDKQKNIEGRVVAKTQTNIRLETEKDEMVFVPYVALVRSQILKKRSIEDIEHKKKK